MKQFNSKIIIACDFEDKSKLFSFLKNFGDKKLFLKLGMQILYKEGLDLISEIKSMGHDVFVDLKILDIPNTSKNAITSLLKHNPDLITVHSLGGRKMLEEVADAVKDSETEIVAVTILTSLNQNEVDELNISKKIEDEVEDLIQIAKESGIKYIVSSANESNIVREKNLFSITPGIRLAGDSNDDQSRVLTPVKAMEAGSNLLVIGRSITNSSNPLQTYENIEREINERNS